MNVSTYNFPKVLVFSNNSFSKSNSNGRTLGSLFEGWPKDNIAQFFISTDNIDFSVCYNYFQVTDWEATKSVFIGERAITGTKVKQTLKVNNKITNHHKKHNKNALKMIVRNIIWNIKRWKGPVFKDWLQNFDPDLVLIQSGDSAFMLRIARQIAFENAVPLIIFNTEGYFFFKHNFLPHHFSDFFAFPIFKFFYDREFKKSLKFSSASIYLNSQLQSDYFNFLPHDSFVIYNSSSLDFRPKSRIRDIPKISYLGNLGIKRDEALAEVGTVLQSISPDLYIDVYGNAPEIIKVKLNNAKGIRFHGVVSYNEVIKQIYDSDIVIHVEKNDPILNNELKYAFSTKIADSISSGTPFIIYAPKNLACSQYLISTQAGWNAETPEELKNVIEKLLNITPCELGIYAEKAKIAAKNNHSQKNNAERFRQIIEKVTIQNLGIQ